MRLTALVLLIVFAASCSSGKKSPEEDIRTYDTATLYYDIPLAIQNEIAEIKRTFAVPYVITKANNQRDSVSIDTTRLVQLAKPFLECNLNDGRYRKFYKEDLFEDGDTKSIVLNYSTNHPDLAVRSASVLLDNETQQLKRIDIIRSFAAKDSSTEERLSWTAGKNFQLIKIISAQGKELISQTNVFWND